MARLASTSSLARGHSDMLEYQIGSTHAGMAHFANTGPLGATCGECVFLGYHRQYRNQAGDLVKVVHRGGCKKFHELTGKHGDIVPTNAAACRYFERKKDK